MHILHCHLWGGRFQMSVIEERQIIGGPAQLPWAGSHAGTRPGYHSRLFANGHVAFSLSCQVP